MERITINSNLSGFTLLDAIKQVNRQQIAAVKWFADAPAYLAIEALAQLGAWHTRFLSQFEKHVFLLTIKSCQVAPGEQLNGEFQLQATLTGQSRSACSHLLRGGKQGQTVIEGRFLFAAIEYAAPFNRNILQTHYQRVFSCLTSASNSAC